MGRAAVQAAFAGKSGVMIGLERISTSPYQVRLTEVPLDQVMLVERKLPDTWINPRGNDVPQEFVDWCRPLVGGPVGDYLQFTKIYIGRNMGKYEAYLSEPQAL